MLNKSASQENLKLKVINFQIDLFYKGLKITVGMSPWGLLIHNLNCKHFYFWCLKFFILRLSNSKKNKRGYIFIFEKSLKKHFFIVQVYNWNSRKLKNLNILNLMKWTTAVHRTLYSTNFGPLRPHLCVRTLYSWRSFSTQSPWPWSSTTSRSGTQTSSTCLISSSPSSSLGSSFSSSGLSGSECDGHCVG